MKISVGSEAPAKRAISIRFVPKDGRAKIVPAVADAEFSARANALFYARADRVLHVGLGERAKITAATFRSAAGAAAMFLKKIGEHELALRLEEWPQFAGPAVEGVLLADYRFEQFKTQKTPGLTGLSVHVLPKESAAPAKAVQHAQKVAEATNAVRAIGNLPGNLLYPSTLAEHATRIARRAKLKITVLDEKALAKGKFGGLLAVGQGSVRPPQIILEHRGGPKAQPPVALVGKAITFDTGGISIKPAANMEEMIFDKCGGIAVLGAMAALATLGVKRNVVGVIASAENMPGGNAYRPGDIVTTYDGKHIEIVNTDAEGRVVLADAIAYARRDLGAAAIVDLATLTGACGVALGEYAAGFWKSSDEELGHRVLKAAETAGERLWPMPLFEEYDTQIKSDVALVKNSGGRLGGACTAAMFLKTFAEDTPRAHLDIAYTGHREKDKADLARGATGFGVRTLVELIESWK